MRSKKLISLLCAAALSMSSFAGLAVTASAEETVLWSDTFDGYENTVKYYHEDKLSYDNKVLVDGTTVAANLYEGIEGITLTTTNRTDDSSYFQLTEDEGAGKALTTQVSRFSNADRGAKITFKQEYAPTADNDLVLAFKVKVSNAAETTYDEAFCINGVASYVDLGDAARDWTDIKAVITTSGTNVYVGDESEPKATFAGVTKLTDIRFDGLVDGVNDTSDVGAQKAASNPFGYPTFSIDDMVVYTTEAGNGLASAVPQAETHGTATIVYETVPKGEAPEDLGLVAEDIFNSAATDRLIYIGTDGESVYTSFNAINLKVGPAADAQGETKWSVIGNKKTDPVLGEKYLNANNGPRSTANRGPKMEFKKSTVEERETVVAYFATRLHKGDNGPAEVIFSGDITASDSKGDIASPLAMITTDATAASSVYACANPLVQNSDNVLQVNDNEWLLVKIEAYRSEGKTAGAKISVTTNSGKEDEATTYIFGSADTYADIKDSTKSGVNTLPFISFRSGNDTDYGVSNSSNDIDNVAVYSSNADAPVVPSHSVEITYDSATKKATVSTTEVAMFDAIFIQARDHKVVKLKELAGISASGAKSVTDVTALEGDVFYVWSSLAGLVPYGTKTITAAEGVTSYDITVTAPENGTVTPNVTKAAEGDTVTLEVKPTEGYELETLKANDTNVTATNGVYSFTMPAANVTVTATFKAKTYTVTGTVDAGVEKVVLHPANDTEHTNDIEAKIAETTATFEKVPAGTYAVTATAKSGYENPVIKKGEETVTEITVTDADVADAFAITTTKTPDPVITGTVTITGDVTVGSELTATVEGLNEGKTAKYAWATADTANGTYTAVEGQSTNKLKLTDAMLNKFVKVTVTADGTTGEKTYVTTTAVAAKTYTVTGTVDAGVDTVKLHVKDAADHTADIKGTIKDAEAPATGKVVEFANVPAGTYTVEATAATGYKNAVSNPAEITVGETTTSFAVTTTKVYTVTGTVDAGVYTVKLHVKDAADHTADIEGTIKDAEAPTTGKVVEFANVVAGTYTVEATAKTGYKNAVSTPAEITVGETTTSFAVTTTKILSVTGTVDAGVKTVKLQPETGDALTANIENGTVTFADVANGEYTVVVETVDALFTNPVVKIGENAATDNKITVNGADVAITVTTTDTAIYRANLAGLSGKVSTSMVQADFADPNAPTAEEVALFSVGDFGEGTAKTTAVPALDGWGYMHTTNNGMMSGTSFNGGRQSSAIVNDACSNGLAGQGAGNTGVNGPISFIPKNATLNGTLPTTGKIVYTFDAVVKTTGTSKAATSTFGLTAADDGTSIDSVASTTVDISTTTGETVTKKMVITYSLDNQTYTITVDGTQVANGKASKPATGIYAASPSAGRYVQTGIDNLIVTTAENTPVVKINTVNAAEGESATADKFEAQADDTITITVKKNAGRKVSVTAKDDNEAPIAVTESDGKYTFTMPAEGNATVTVTYARADVTSVTVNGDTTQIQKGQSASGYTVTLKAGETEVVGDVVWTVVGKTSADTKFENGTLTIGADETAETVTLTATTRTDITVDSDDNNTISGTKTITVVSEPVYNITKGTETNGTFKINVGSTENATTAKTGDTITIVPAPAVGYVVSEVSYTPNGGDKQVVANNEGYKVTGITADITVNVTFTAIDYTITNSNATADENNNSIKIKVGVAEASAEASVIANYQNTITVEPIIAEGYKLSTLTYQVGTDEPVDILSAKSFSMPASDVTVNATFIVKPVLTEALTIYSNNFDETSDFTPGGKTDGTTHNPGAVTSRAEGKVIAVGSASGDANLTSPSFSTLENYTTAVNTYDATKFNVSFDFKLEGVYSGKGSSIALLGGTSSSGWLNSNKQILTINMKCGSTAGYFSELAVNGVDVLSTLKESTATYDIGKLNRDSTGWVTLNSTIDFATKKVTFSLSKNDAVVVAEQTVDFVNTDTTVLDRLFMAAGKSYGGVYVDNLVVEAAPTATAP